MKAQVVPAPTGLPATKRVEPVAADKFIPRTPAEHNLVEAIEEMKELVAGRKQGVTLKQFLDELD